MASSGNQQIAWLFIFLLAGHEVVEASRISKARQAEKGKQGANVQAVGGEASAVAPTPRTDAEAEQVFQAENGHCGSFMMFCGAGPTHEDVQHHEVHRCASQPLKGDIKSSTKCRLTDEWMLDGTEEKPVTWWVNLQVMLIKAKAEKFSKKCAMSKKHIPTGVCLRRMQHILRGVKFLSKAATKGVFVKMSPAQQQEIAQTSQIAQDALAAAMMSTEQQQLFKRLLAASQANLDKAPMNTIALTLQVLEQNILAEDFDSTQAEEKVKEIEDNAIDEEVLGGGVEGLREQIEIFEEQVVMDDEVVEEQSVSLDSDEEAEIFEAQLVDLDATLEDVMKGVEEEINEGDDSSSLLELDVSNHDKYNKIVKVGGFAAMAILMVLGPLYVSAVMVSYVITWIGTSLLGCTAYMVGRHSGKGELAGKSLTGPLAMTPQWGSCVSHWVTSPFRLVYKAARWMSGDHKSQPPGSVTPVEDNQAVA